MTLQTRTMQKNGEQVLVASQAKYLSLLARGWTVVTDLPEAQPIQEVRAGQGGVTLPTTDAAREQYVPARLADEELRAASVAAARDVTAGHLAQRYKSKRYYYVSSPGTSTTGSQNNQQMKAIPWFVAAEIVVDRLFVEVATAGQAGSLVRLGVYKDDGGGEPGELLVDAGTVDAATAGQKEITLASPVTLPPGFYWAAAGITGGATTVPILRGLNAALTVHPGSATLPGASGSYAAVIGNLATDGTFPLSWATTGSPSGNGPRIGFRVG